MILFDKQISFIYYMSHLNKYLLWFLNLVSKLVFIDVAKNSPTLRRFSFSISSIFWPLFYSPVTKLPRAVPWFSSELKCSSWDFRVFLLLFIGPQPEATNSPWAHYHLKIKKSKEKNLNKTLDDKLTHRSEIIPLQCFWSRILWVDLNAQAK